MASSSLNQEEDGFPPNPPTITSPDALRPFSRSPHPYHRKSASTSKPSEPSAPEQRPSSSSTHLAPPRWSRNSSDSGTEADDESTGILKGLPAPPVRPRKGLRAQDAEDPWLSTLPFLARAIARRSPRGSGEETGTGTGTGNGNGNKLTKARGKLNREKRVEVLRRLLEVALLVSVGAVVVQPEDVRSLAWAWRKELSTHALLVTGLYTVYPFRVSRGRPRLFRIPASFDPAPLLYPITIPIFVALSLTHHRPALVLPNILLGLSSLPTPVIPLHAWGHGYSIVHWMITLVPLLVAEHFSWGDTVLPKPLSLYGIDSETLTLVFPLQQALIPILDFLLATSLLPAELQLLATALVNLFLFASSPQATILKALLWLGGLCIFISCRHVLGWEVALARIPTWKFRRYPGRSQSQKNLLNLLDHDICERLCKSAWPEEVTSDSDLEEELFSSPATVPHRTMHEIPEQPPPPPPPPQQQQQHTPKEPTSANYNVKPEEGFSRYVNSAHQRRHTISTFEEVAQSRNIRTTAKGRRKRSMAPGLASFLAMSIPQAQVRKWMYAAYTYAAIAAIAIGPVRMYVGEQGLNGEEPFGWALGYLFGNFPLFRLWVVMGNREHWIRLPARKDEEMADASCVLGSVEHLRQNTFGEANMRLMISAYCSAVVLTGLAVVFKLSSVAEVDTRRKVFHGMMVLMFLPTIYIDPTFCGLALGTVLAIFLLLDLFRASQLPPISRPLMHFLAPYVDGRDHRGPVIVSHIFLLIGCSIPLWLSLADISRTGDSPWSGWNATSRDVSMVSGVICVGMGDAAASLIGRRFGRLKWFWGGGKSLEGSVAFALAVSIGLMFARMWLAVGRWPVTHGIIDDGGGDSWVWALGKAALAAGGTSATEAILTGCNDNVVVPVVLWLLVRGVRL